MTIKRFVVMMFIFSILYMSLGLYIGKKYAQDNATRVATAQAVLINNRTTCALRSLVDPPIAGYKRSLIIQQKIAYDTKRSEPVRDTAKANIRSITKTVAGLESFRNIYNTVPPDFDCKSLIKQLAKGDANT